MLSGYIATLLIPLIFETVQAELFGRAQQSPVEPVRSEPVEPTWPFDRLKANGTNTLKGQINSAGKPKGRLSALIAKNINFKSNPMEVEL
ncbi:MAG: hypothetical protein PHY16_00360 [Methylobacter sp.]|nr:hypothetical protein [Methylobacter sp.]